MLSLAYLGDIQGAEGEYERGKVLFGGQWPLGDEHITNIRLGTGKVVLQDDIPYSNPITYAVKKHLDSPEDGILELRRLFADEDNLSSSDLFNMSSWAAYFGDTELAMDVMEKAIGLEALMVQWLWLPSYQEVRQLPRFKELLREIGLVDFWNEFGWPDICHKLDSGDFECD